MLDCFCSVLRASSRRGFVIKSNGSFKSSSFIIFVATSSYVFVSFAFEFEFCDEFFFSSSLFVLVVVVAFVVVTVEGTGGTNSLAEEVNGIFTMSTLLSIDATPSDANLRLRIFVKGAVLFRVLDSRS